MSYTRKDLGDPAAIAGTAQPTPITVPGIQPRGLILAINDSPYAVDIYLDTAASRVTPRSVREIRIGQNPPSQVAWSVAYDGGSAGGSDVLLEIYDPGTCPNPFSRAGAALASSGGSGGSQLPLALASLNLHDFYASVSGSGYAGSETPISYSVTTAGVYRGHLAFDELNQNNIAWQMFWQHYIIARNITVQYYAAAYDTIWHNNANPPLQTTLGNTYFYAQSTPEPFQTIPVLMGAQPGDTISLLLSCPQTGALSSAPGVEVTASLEHVN